MHSLSGAAGYSGAAGDSGATGDSGAAGGSGAAGDSGGHAGTPSSGGSAASPEPTPIPAVERGDELCGSAPGGSEQGIHALRFENADAGVTVQIGRAFLNFGIGHSSIYGLTGFSLSIEGTEHCSGDFGDITRTSYENTHHNWEDRASGTLEGGTRYELYLGREFVNEEFGEWAPTLSAFDASSGESVLDPIPLVSTGGPVSCSDCPSYVPVIVSEVMASNESTFADEHGEYEPWIELYNPSGSAVSLAGWSLSNDLGDRTLWTFPEVSIPRHGYLVVFADAQPEQGDLHTNFRLSEAGGAVILTTPRGTTSGGQAFGPQEPDASFGFLYTAGAYVWMPEPTPGAANPTN